MFRFDPGFGRVVPPGHPYTVGGGWRGPPEVTSNWHMGLDIAMPVGTPLLAAGDGVVTAVTPTPVGDVGIHVQLKHAGGLLSRYLHMSHAMVGLGQAVRRGQQIGLSGNTGLSSGPHLHFDMRAPPELVPKILAATGGKAPPTGLGPNLGALGTAVPSEPWLPVDGYAPAVIALARTNGIPLYPEISHMPPWLIPAMALGAGALGLIVIARRRGAI